MSRVILASYKYLLVLKKHMSSHAQCFLYGLSFICSEGQVVEQGSHEVLMKQEKGVYRSMWELQAAEEEQHHHHHHSLHPGMTMDEATLESDLLLISRRGTQYLNVEGSSDEENMASGAVRRKFVV
jgi:hypothetical protein